MQQRTRFIIKNVDEGIYLNRMADGLTRSMFSALWFHTLAEAEHWMLGIYAPKEGYEITETLTTIQEVEKDERDNESVSEDSGSHEGHSISQEG